MADSAAPELDAHSPAVPMDPAGKASIEGKQQFDFNGDGTAEESVLGVENALVLKSRSKKVITARRRSIEALAQRLVRHLQPS